MCSKKRNCTLYSKILTKRQKITTPAPSKLTYSQITSENLIFSPPVELSKYPHTLYIPLSPSPTVQCLSISSPNCPTLTEITENKNFSELVKFWEKYEKKEKILYNILYLCEEKKILDNILDWCEEKKIVINSPQKSLQLLKDSYYLNQCTFPCFNL